MAPWPDSPSARRAGWRWIATWTISFVGVLYSVYLTTVSITLLGATCPYCLTSLAIMAALFVVATIQRPSETAGLRVASAAPAGRAHRGGRRRAPAPELRGHARRAASGRGSVHARRSPCISRRGAPRCTAPPGARTASNRRRCSAPRPGGCPTSNAAPAAPVRAQASACLAAGIRQYPTWIIGGKRFQEVLTPTRLAELTAFQPPAPTTAGP